MGAPAFTVGTAGLDALFEDYRITIMAEGKSPKTLEAARTALTQFQHFLYYVGSPEDVTVLTRNHVKAFSLYLKSKPCFTSHPYTPTQGRRLSGHTLNCYLRTLRVFLGWCQEEGYIVENPFWGFSIPQPPKKVVPALLEVRVKALINAIDQSTPTGFRNYVMILTLLDTGLRSSELLNLDRLDVDLDQGMLRVLGKGNKERMVPIGRQVQQLLVDYIRDYRSRPTRLARKRLFLTEEGQPMDGGSLNRIMRRLKRKAGINGAIVGYANLAGLGEQGRHMIEISPVHGSSIREPAMLITDLPLSPTKPIDFGAYEFCKDCGLCAEACPFGCIQDGEPTWEHPNPWNNNGYLGWPADTSKCPHCPSCQGVCPFNTLETGGAIHDIVKPIISNTSIFNSFFVNMEKTMGYAEKRDPRDWFELERPSFGIDTRW